MGLPLACRPSSSTLTCAGSSRTRLKPAPFMSAQPGHTRGARGGGSSSTQRRQQRYICNIWPFDVAWGPSIDASTLSADLFSVSLFPYLAFLFFLTRSKQTPPLSLFGFYFLLAFVGASIPAGIYAKQHYHTALANVDWLHGGAESLLTVTNLLIVLGMRGAIRQAEAARAAAEAPAPEVAAEELATAAAGGQQRAEH
eukprot:scaffold20.g7706.t1